MIKYIGKRLGLGLVTLFLLTTLTFFLLHIMPGSPFNSEQGISPVILQALEEKYHLNEPILKQYVYYMADLLQGDLGESFKQQGVFVNDIIARGVPYSFKLGIVAFFISVIVGCALGILATFNKNKYVQGIVMTLSTIGVSVPSFILALLLMLIFGVSLKWLPIVGLKTPLHYILPSIALSLYPIAFISRLVRTNLVEVMKQDYIVLARSKGLSWPVIILKHGLKNAMLPVVTYLGPLIAFLLTGSFVVENLFSIPGIGTEFVKSITNRDYSVVLGLTIFLGAFVILANLVVDLICVLIDPRIKSDS